MPAAPPGAITIDPAALEDASRLADAKNASALLVLHEDRVVLERHWRGSSARRLDQFGVDGQDCHIAIDRNCQGRRQDSTRSMPLPPNGCRPGGPISARRSHCGICSRCMPV